MTKVNVLGIELKRKLTRKESARITKEVMDLNLNDSHLNFQMAVMKSIECIQGG